MTVQTGGFKRNLQNICMSSYRVDITRACDIFQITFQSVSDGRQIICADRIVVTEQRHTHDGYIVDTHRFYNRLKYTEVGWEPITVTMNLVVQIKDGFTSGHANLECNSQDCLSGLTDRENIIHPLYF